MRNLPDTAEPDLTAARKLIALTRPKQKNFQIAVGAGNQQTLQVAQLVADAAKRIGLHIGIKQLQPSEFSQLFFRKPGEGPDYGIVTVGYAEVPWPTAYAPLVVKTGGPWNTTGYSDERVDRYFTLARTATDPKESARAFVRAQAIYAEEAGIIELGNPHERLFMNKRITGAPASFAYINMPWAAGIGSAE